MSSTLTISTMSKKESIKFLKGCDISLAYMQITENNLELGDVLSVTSDNGKNLKALQMLIGDKTRATISRDVENNCAVFKVEDTDISSIPALMCNLKKSTIKNLICGLKEIYNLLEDDE